MKTALECLPCYLRQSLRVARLQGCSKERQHEVMRKVAALLPELDLERTPPANSMGIYAAIAAVTGCDDPYLSVKREENSRALARLPELRERVRSATEPFNEAVSHAIAGNLIDYGAAGRSEIEAAFATWERRSMAIDHRQRLGEKVAALKPGATVLYLADNCGEIVYDALVLELLAEKGLDITVAVKSGPIINDALIEDAHTVGLDRVARIIANGTACPGTPLESCSAQFLRHFETADLVISKGQGNFETLSEARREIFFLLSVKCGVVGRHLARLASVDPALLPGKGEMTVYHSEKRGYDHDTIKGD